ncbi:putative reverse transcriptase domain-containing protein, partial [Tanacetum coccineum]
MTTTRQGMSSAEIDQIVAQRVTDAIEAIAIYETKISMTHDSMNQVIRQETTIEKNANNNRKFETNQRITECHNNHPSRNWMWQGLTLLEPMERRLMLGIYLTATSVGPCHAESNIKYPIELVNGRLIGSNTVLRGCTLGLLGHPFNIDLMPVELGSFDLIIGMDWLANHHAVIVYDEKIVRIPMEMKF